MDANYYKEYYYLEREHWYFRARNKIICDHIESVVKDKKNLKILNVGAATGFTSEMLSQFGSVKSVEYDIECYNFTKENLDLDIINGSILDLPFGDNEYDLVCAFDVIEHVEDDNLAVKEMSRVCKKDGIVAVTVPAFKFLWSHHDEVNHHFRRYTKKQLIDLFEDKSKFLYHSYYNFWLFPPIAAFRSLNNLFSITKKSDEDTGSDFSVVSKDSVFSKILYKLFYSESFFVRKHIKLPFGVSLISSWRK